MPQIYVKKGTRTGEIDEDAIESAMKEVLDKTGSQKYGVKPTTLESSLTKSHKKASVEKENNIPARVFSPKFTSNQESRQQVTFNTAAAQICVNSWNS